ncbi:MAG: hypothetical protein R2867_18855 [Caldilineaceae bacterium]
MVITGARGRARHCTRVCPAWRPHWFAGTWRRYSGARRDVEALGGWALLFPIDVADAEAVEAAAAEVEATFGPIDFWVNNAMTSVFSRSNQ